MRDVIKSSSHDEPGSPSPYIKPKNMVNRDLCLVL